MTESERLAKLRNDSKEEILAGRRRFEELDHRATAAAVGMLKSAAALAKERPEEFFGLVPTERDLYVAQALQFLNAEAGRAPEGSGLPGRDVTGEAPPAWVAVLGEMLLGWLLDKAASGAEDVLDEGWDFLMAEKEYWLGLGE